MNRLVANKKNATAKQSSRFSSFDKQDVQKGKMGEKIVGETEKKEVKLFLLNCAVFPLVNSAKQKIKALKNTSSKFPARGINVRRIDHLNLLAADVAAFRDFQLNYLGGRLTETIVFSDASGNEDVR